MNIRATISDCGYGLDGSLRLTLAVPQQSADATKTVYEKLNGKELDVSLKRHSEKRSLGANALMWKCLSGLAEALDISNMDAYLQCLKDYGTYTFIVVSENAVDYTRRLFRVVEDLGTITVGQSRRGRQLQVWPGSSTYNVQMMTRLLNGVIRECANVGAWVPDERDVALSIDLWRQEVIHNAEQDH